MFDIPSFVVVDCVGSNETMAVSGDAVFEMDSTAGDEVIIVIIAIMQNNDYKYK